MYRLRYNVIDANNVYLKQASTPTTKTAIVIDANSVCLKQEYNQAFCFPN